MSQPFISNVALAIGGAVVVVSSLAFSLRTTGWVTFGVSLGALAMLALTQRVRAGERIQQMLDVEIALLALWSAVASVVYSGSTLKWLSFAEGLAFVGLAVAGLSINVVRAERVVRSLDSVPSSSGDEDELQAAA